MPSQFRFIRLGRTSAAIIALIPVLGFVALARAADLDVPTVAYPTLQAAVTEAEGNGDALNTIYVHGRVTTNAQVTLGAVFDASRTLIFCPAADEERAFVESANGSQPAFFLNGCHNVTFRDLDIVRNITNAADLIRIDHAEDCTIERSRLGSIWSVPGAPGTSVMVMDYPKGVVVRNCILFAVYPGTFDRGIWARNFNDDERSLFLYNNVVADSKIYGIHIDDGVGVPGSFVVLRNNVVANHPAMVAEPFAWRSNVDGATAVITSHNVALATFGFQESVAAGARTIAGTGIGGAFLRYNRDQVNPIFLNPQWVTVPAWDPNPDFYMLEPLVNPMHDDAGDYGVTVADGAPAAEDHAVTDDLQKNARPSGTVPHTDRGADQLEVTGLALGPGWHWYPLTAAPQGTPPTVTLLTTSSPQQTELEIVVNGFYYWTVVQAGQTFVRVSLREPEPDPYEVMPETYEPEPQPYLALGRPELPILGQVLGGLCGNIIGQPEVDVLSEVSIPGARVYPVQLGRNDHPGDPDPPFQWDQAYYQQTVKAYPATRAAARDSAGSSCGLTLLRADIHPLRLIPVSHVFHVPAVWAARHLRVRIPHGSCPTPPVKPVSRRIARAHEILLTNNPVVSLYRPPEVGVWKGDYLFVILPEHREEIDPLVEQKRRRGYRTTVVSTDVTGRTCEGIKDYIADWYHDGDPGTDHYVLLVGDADDIPSTEDLPVCSDENNNASDKMYACIDGVGADGLPDPYPEVYIGRLPCDNESECSDMVTKILTYEAGYPLGAAWLDNVLLTSHMEDYPAQYTQNQNEVAEAVYSTPPVFTLLHGGEGASNDDVIAEIEAGMGVVCYRGHGWYTNWYQWNGDYFTNTTIDLIDNGDKTPVVFSFACSNGAMDSLDLSGGCMAEEWLETTHRGVACYAASGGSSTSANHYMNKALFKAIYDDDFVILAEAIATQEARTIAAYGADPRGEATAWQYNLFGDPELKVWREDVPPLFVVMSATSVTTGPGTVVVHVYSGGGGGSAGAGAEGVSGSTGPPVALAIVTAYKDGEFVASRYTDANGEAQIPIDPTTPGTIDITVTTEFDSYAEARGAVTVTSNVGIGDASSPGAALALEPAWPNPASARSSIAYVLPRGGRARLGVFDLAGRRVATLTDGVQPAGRHTVAWDGRDSGGSRLGGGVFFVKLEFEGETRSTRIARMN